MESTTPVRPYPLGERMRGSTELINKNMALYLLALSWRCNCVYHTAYSHAVVLQRYLSASPKPSTAPFLPADVLSRHAHLPVGNYHFFAIWAETLTLCKSLDVSSLSSLACIGALCYIFTIIQFVNFGHVVWVFII